MQIQVLKPQLHYAVNYKLNGKHTVNKYLYEHGFRFKNKDERNEFIMKFLANMISHNARNNKKTKRGK